MRNGKETSFGMETQMNEKRRSMMKKQKIAIWVLAVVVLLLIVTLLIVNHVVAIYTLTDTWVKDGETYREKYTVKRSDGVYKMFSGDGELMQTTENGYTSGNVRYEVYVAKSSGNQYLVNTSTGEYSAYAIVDYDASAGELLSGGNTNKRILLFPRIPQDNVFSIEVTNENGSYRFERTNVKATNATYTTQVALKQTENSLAEYDAALFASLCVSCGYPLSVQKLDLGSAEAPKLSDGSINLKAYGLDTPSAEFTITEAVFAANGSASASDTKYTVRIGNRTLSGNGYYAMLEGRNFVYILSSTLETTVLQPVESLVTPQVIYPMTDTTYPMVFEFELGKAVGNFDKENPDLNLITAFDYVDYDQRESSYYSSKPYTSALSMMDGYPLNHDSIAAALERLHSMQFVGCKKVAPSDEDLKAYHLDENIFYISYLFDPKIASTGSPKENWIENVLLISQKTDAGTHYVYSYLYDMITEVDQTYLPFLEWRQSKWYDEEFFQENLAYIKELKLESYTAEGETEKSYFFTLDNSATDQSEMVGVDNMKIYLGEGNEKKRIDYRLGSENALDNFKRFYVYLISYGIEGDVDENALGMSVKDYIATHPCTGSFTYRLEDTASILNKYYKENHKENNRCAYEIKFYRYSERKMLITIKDLLNEDATEQGSFYVNAEYWNRLLTVAQDFLDQKEIPNLLS